MIRFVIISFLLLAGSTAFAQDAQEFFRISQQTNKAGMFVLGSWALANISSGAYGWNRFDGSKKYFYQMNLMWNAVNLGIAGVALYSFSLADPASMSAAEMMRVHLRSENLFLINAGLDILYIGGGIYMKHLADKGHKKEEMLRGYGNSVILQGGFLMAFDLAMYFIQRQHRLGYDPALFSVSPLLNMDGIGLAIRF